MSSSTPLASPDAAPAPSAAARALAFYWGNYLPLMMVFVVFFGYLIPAPGESPTHLPAAGARLTRARAGAGKALDKPKIELCSEGDADCEMGTIKVPPPPTPTPPRRGSSLAPAQPAAHNPHSGAAEPARALLLGAAFPAPPPDPCPAGVAGHLLALRHLHLHPLRCGTATRPPFSAPQARPCGWQGSGSRRMTSRQRWRRARRSSTPSSPSTSSRASSPSSWCSSLSVKHPRAPTLFARDGPGRVLSVRCGRQTRRS